MISKCWDETQWFSLRLLNLFAPQAAKQGYHHKQRGTSVSYLIKDTISTKRGNYEKKK